MLTLFYAPGACSMAPHIVLEESGEKYEPRRMDLAKGEQKSPEYMKVHPMGRVPALKLDDGTPLTENTAILPYLGKRFGMWPSDPIGEAKSLSRIGYFAATVHPAHAHFGRPERYVTEPAAIANVKEVGLKSFHGYLQEIDRLLAGQKWCIANQYTVIDPYLLVFYRWGNRSKLPVKELKNYTALVDRVMSRPAVHKVMTDEGITLD